MFSRIIWIFINESFVIVFLNLLYQSFVVVDIVNFDKLTTLARCMSSYLKWIFVYFTFKYLTLYLARILGFSRTVDVDRPGCRSYGKLTFHQIFWNCKPRPKPSFLQNVVNPTYVMSCVCLDQSCICKTAWRIWYEICRPWCWWGAHGNHATWRYYMQRTQF